MVQTMDQFSFVHEALAEVGTQYMAFISTYVCMHQKASHGAWAIEIGSVERKKNGKELEFLMSMVINLTIVLDTGSKFYTSYEL